MTGIAAEIKKEIFTVTELTRRLKHRLETEFPGFWLEGEVSGFKHHTSGHMYFSLKDEQSLIKAVFFSRNNFNLSFKPGDGIKVLCYGRISVYEPRGDYQFYVERMEPQGAGALQLAFEQLKNRLHQEGLFDEKYKKPIPLYPRTVALVTSPAGAAIKDMLKVMERRVSGIEVLIYPVKVQGEGAAAEIAQAIADLNARGNIDVLIVGRGGGSLEDLWAFNEEKTVRAVFASGIPVISAVGHEVDWTLCDLVSDLRAPTPSVAAELVTRGREGLELRLEALTKRLGNALRQWVETRRQAVRRALDSFALREPLALLDPWIQKVDDGTRRLQKEIGLIVERRKQAAGTLLARLEGLSPLAVLARGYGVVMDARGGVIKEAANVKKNDTIEIRLQRGRIRAIVESTQN